MYLLSPSSNPTSGDQPNDFILSELDMNLFTSPGLASPYNILPDSFTSDVG